MARKVKDKALDSREARSKLKARGKPYYRAIEPGLHLGYRKLKSRAGTWVCRHYVGAQVYEVESIGTVDDLSDADGVAILSYWQAQDEARKRMVQRAHAAAGKTGPLTVCDVVEAYLEFLDSNRKSGADARVRANALIYPQLGDLEVGSLTTERMQRWHADLAKAPPRLRTKPGDRQRHGPISSDDEALRRRRSTANRTLTTLKAALNRAWRHRKVTSDNAWRRVEPFENVNAARMRYLTIAEAKRLINASDPEFRQLVQAALQTGARYGELARLEVHDFNPDAGTVAIRQSKSGKPRHVVLTEEGAALFKQLAAGKSGKRLLIPKASGAVWLKSHQARPMAKACAVAKIDPPISFHILRHTWASHAIMNGVPLLVVAKNLGHSDTRMVEKHYGHLGTSYVADAIRAAAPRFGFEADSKVVAL